MDNTITLTPFEIQFVTTLTQERTNFNGKNVCNTPYGGFTSASETMLVGTAGELAFCKHFGLYPSFDTSSYPTFDVMYQGYKIEIKTNPRTDRSAWLGVKETKKVFADPPDYYCGMFGSGSSIWFGGFISSSAIINKGHYRKWGYHPMFTAGQSELIPELPKKQQELNEQLIVWDFEVFTQHGGD